MLEYFDWLEQEAEEQRREERGERVERFVPPGEFIEQEVEKQRREHEQFLSRRHADFAKCCEVVKQVVRTWSPPLRDDPANRCLETCVQTGFMGALGVAMGEDFPWHELNETQQIVTRQFIARTDKFLAGKDKGDA